MSTNDKPRGVFNVLRVEGMAPGRGRPAPAPYQNVPTARVTGEGTLSNPWVGWVYDLTGRGPRVIRRCTEIVREEAMKLNMTYAWVRSVNHQGKTARSKSNAQVMVPAQSHITVAFGTSSSRILWEGHIWTKDFADATHAPQRILQPSELEEEGGNPKLWASGSYPYNLLPSNYPHSFKLTPQDTMVVYKRPAPSYYSEPEDEPL
ncbi:hypothetical protein F5Y13DRAFT_189294 [Hypoxylon sp. FL1857]|nr:hypothetical protein F5Y13DRAFT_189294 [Hypoxylon sp. FL1857]